jgi:hypothetical protein
VVGGTCVALDGHERPGAAAPTGHYEEQDPGGDDEGQDRRPRLTQDDERGEERSPPERTPRDQRVARPFAHGNRRPEAEQEEGSLPVRVAERLVQAPVDEQLGSVAEEQDGHDDEPHGHHRRGLPFEKRAGALPPRLDKAPRVVGPDDPGRRPAEQQLRRLVALSGVEALRQ